MRDRHIRPSYTRMIRARHELPALVAPRQIQTSVAGALLRCMTLLIAMERNTKTPDANAVAAVCFLDGVSRMPRHDTGRHIGHTLYPDIRMIRVLVHVE
jgi:hypothetical protein